MNSEQICLVLNRSSGAVGYVIPEDNIHRMFAPGETKKITFEELEKLSFTPGGDVLLAEYLMVQSTDALQELEIPNEPEYNMTENDVIKMLQEGSLDEFLDCLDFAPIGVIDLIKTLSVDLPLNDVQKREAIKNKFNFDVSAAIQHKKEAEEEEDAPILKQPERRVKKETKAPGRRADAPKYIIPEAPAEVKE